MASSSAAPAFDESPRLPLGRVVSEPSCRPSSIPLRHTAGVARRQLQGIQALVLAGGRGSRLGALTDRRAKPAVPIAGRHRIIDFTLSNCVNSGIANIGVLTQYLAGTLVPHLSAWGARHRGHLIRNLPAHSSDGYKGTADAVHQNRDVIRSRSAAQVLILAADHVYRMDYAAMLETHLQSGAQLTVGCVEVPLAAAREFGVMQTDGSGRVRSFVEKPECPGPIPGQPERALASMGIYLFDTEFLLALLAADAENPFSSHDFGKDVLPSAVDCARVQVHALRDLEDPMRPGYWRDVGTLDAFWRTNLELIGAEPSIDLGNPDWPLRGVGDAGFDPDRERCFVVESAISPDARLGAACRIERSVILPGVRIGPDSLIRNAIVAEGASLPAGTRIGVDPALDSARYPLTRGGVLLVA